MTNHTGQHSGTIPCIKTSYFRAGLSEDGIISSDCQVTDNMQHMTAADCITGNHGHDRLRNRTDKTLQIKNIEARHLVFSDITAMSADRLVTAGTERFVPCAGYNNHPDCL